VERQERWTAAGQGFLRGTGRDGPGRRECSGAGSDTLRTCIRVSGKALSQTIRQRWFLHRANTQEHDLQNH
jgi:hypothetical protein